MKILLAGLLERDAAAINILVRMAWRDHQVVSLPRQLSLAIPGQDSAARACKCCIIDLAGLGLRQHSRENEVRLHEFLAGRPGLLIVRGGGGGWLDTGTAGRGEKVKFLKSPYTTNELREALKKTMAKVGIAAPEQTKPTPSAPGRQPASGPGAQQPAPTQTPEPAWRRALAFAQRQQSSAPAPQPPRQLALHRKDLPQTSGFALFEVFPELNNLPSLKLFRRIVGGGHLPLLLDFENGPALVIHRKERWLATKSRLGELIEAYRDPDMASRLRLTTIPTEEVEQVVRARFSGEFYRILRPLDQATWELVSQAIEGVALNPNPAIGLQLRHIPNLTRLKRVSPVDIQLAAVCAHAPQTIELLLNAFAAHRSEVKRFVALTLACGMASIIDADQAGQTGSAATPTARKPSRGFFRSLMDKLVN